MATALVGCGASPAPTKLPASADFRSGSATLEIEGTWVSCHQMGSCVYHAELVTSEGRRSIELQTVGDAVVPGPGIPAELPVGAYALEFVSTLRGDTIEPNGSLTVLGEEARCEVQFSVDPGDLVAFHAAVAYVPGKCTVDLSSEVANE